MENGELHAPRAAGACEERELLGQGAHSQGRQDAAAADARGECPHRGIALRPGRLDRGTLAGCRSGNQAARIFALYQRGAACLAMAVLARRRLALERYSRPQGGQSLRRSRWPQGRLARRSKVPATGTFEPGHPWRGKPTFEIKYDKPAAQKPMQEAGYGPSKKLSVKIQTSASGSGQMLPLPMNEYLQQALAECYFDVQLDVIEWNTLFTNWRRGVKDPSANGSNATNVTYAAMDPFFALVRFLQSGMAPPVSNNWGFIHEPKFDELVKKARQTFDPAARDAALAELHAASVDDAAFLYVAHDVGPRAISPKVTGVVQPKSWFIDFSLVSMQ